MRRVFPCLAAALALSACGNDRQRPPETPRSATPAGKRTVELSRWGVTFVRPANWRLGDPRPPLIAAISSGQVAVNVWRYRRIEQLPKTAGDLRRAGRALLSAARARDRSLKLLRSQRVRFGGVPGVELVAAQRIGVARRTVRSTHLYAYGGELVIDAYAPPGEFTRVDRDVFGPLLRSLRVERPARR